MAVLKVVLNSWGLAVVGDRDSGSLGFPDIDWDSPAWRRQVTVDMAVDIYYDPFEISDPDRFALKSLWAQRGGIR